MPLRLFSALRQLVKIQTGTQPGPHIQEGSGARRLHFNNGVVQSSMCLDDPWALDLSYTRAMMGFLLFTPAPRHILIIGLGGGSLPKYCYRLFPQARITTVEIDPAVIALRNEFQIPPDDERFQVVEADACNYLAQDNLKADVILLDGYDAQGLPACLCSEAFYAQCQQALSAQGVLVANLWGGEPNRVMYLDRLRGVFNDQVWWSRPHGSSSLVVHALNNEHPLPPWSRLMTQAQTLDVRYGLNLALVVVDWRQRPDPSG